MSDRETATVEVLKAEVRVLLVGNRQVTLSMFRQLDRSPRIEPWGRVRDQKEIWLVGRHLHTGSLVRCAMAHYSLPVRDATDTEIEEAYAKQEAAEDLPLIVLAGLR